MSADRHRIGVLFALLAILAAVAIVLCAVSGVDAKSKPSACEGACAERVQARQAEHRYQRAWSAAPASVRSHLRRIAQCESGGDHRAISPSGQYRGLLQFSVATWRWVSGRYEDPAAQTRWRQWAMGVRLYTMRGGGPGHWPVCSRR